LFIESLDLGDDFLTQFHYPVIENRMRIGCEQCFGKVNSQ